MLDGIRLGGVGTTTPSSSRTRIQAPSFGGNDALRGALRGIAGLKDGLADLGKVLGGGSAANAAQLMGSKRLEAPGRRSVLRSTEEINTRTASVPDRSPEWMGASEPTVEVRGEYTGDRDDLLVATVKKAKGGFRIQVRSSRAGGTQRFDVAADRTGDTDLVLRDGLTLSLSEGDLVAGDALSFQAFAGGGEVAPHNPMNGEGADDAGLDHRVTNGSFELNGTRLRVSASDSIAEVVQRINDADLGVIAKFDADAEGLVFEATEEGEVDIRLGNDTSGFLAAMKLDGARVERGEAPSPAALALSEIPGLETVRSGRLTLNGARIDVDVARDSLGDVLRRIGESNAGITGRLDEEGRVHLEGDGLEDMKLRDDTGLFAALGLSAHNVEAATGTSLSKREATAAVSDVADGLQSLLAAAGGGFALRSAQTDLVTMLRDATDAKGGRIRTGFGLDFRVDGEGNTEVEFGAKGRRRFQKALRTDPGAIVDFFAKADADGKNLMDRIGERVERARTQLEPDAAGSLYSGTL